MKTSILTATIPAILRRACWIPAAAFVLCSTISAEARERVFYYHNDHLGTPQVMTDQNGIVVWAAEYEPFGKAAVNEDADGDGAQVTSNLRFPGQYYDAETGLHYNYHRDYDPGTGRYLQPDPIGIQGGRNHLYVYAGGNPVIWIDPWGLFHYKEGVPPAGKDVEAGLTCMDTCLSTDLGISGGGEQSGHGEGSKHYSGEAADISSRMNPGLDKDKVMCCAKKCGFQFAQGEGDHYHVQTAPGRGGARGELPEKECCDDKAGAAGASGAGQCCGK